MYSEKSTDSILHLESSGEISSVKYVQSNEGLGP